MPVLMFAFLAGILTILSPCILPVVPPNAGTASNRGRRRLAGIVTGFAGMSVAVTVVLASTLAAAGLTTDRLRLASAVLLGTFGATIAIPRIGRWSRRALLFHRTSPLAYSIDGGSQASPHWIVRCQTPTIGEDTGAGQGEVKNGGAVGDRAASDDGAFDEATTEAGVGLAAAEQPMDEAIIAKAARRRSFTIANAASSVIVVGALGCVVGSLEGGRQALNIDPGLLEREGSSPAAASAD
jgi:hypothetical protein